MRISEIETINKKINSEFHNINYENVQNNTMPDFTL